MADLTNGLRHVRSQEHQAVFVRMGEAETDISFAETADTLKRIANRLLNLVDRLHQMPKGLVAQRQHQGFLVLEVEVEGGRRDADPIGNAPDRRVVVALL